MKNLMLLFIAVTFTSLSYSQKSDKIIGTWITQDGDSKITIEKNSDGTFDGKIIWLKEPNRENGEAKLDDKNPDEKLQSRPIKGLEILQGFTYDEDDKEWVDGTIYDPKSGSTYKCLMWFDDDPNTLMVKGYIGVSIIGKKVQWKRAG
ncbi:DUF2147 domain-containing protein [Carboxylicivirga linearis]|uniref:DUF2147 domain-containing protein n=1 Tax=Carboxylicivirga linearis TaxID=1628157 RepID=A0ABS5JVB5_9BACT|nr:DUF2147 domain-containing protein [Carboxylicivirga linearis]MBS2098827.1 DUF2147 domain-containing protein [Carboxylicivirga linearis]